VLCDYVDDITAKTSKVEVFQDGERGPVGFHGDGMILFPTSPSQFYLKTGLGERLDFTGNEDDTRFKVFIKFPYEGNYCFWWYSVCSEDLP